MVKAASWYAKHLYYDNAEQLNLFYFRDLVRYTVDYDLFDEFEAINPKYWHSLQQDKITLHMIYACYLSMIEHPIGNEYSFVELIKFDPEKEFSFVADDPFAIGHYVDDELAKAKVLLAAAEGDAYAKAIVAHGHLE